VTINGPALAGFVAVAETGSVHAAARRLNMSQAALSRRLQRLEAEVGIPLFVRTGRRLNLSDAGASLLARTRPHLEGLTAALKEAKGRGKSARSSVTFGCLPSVSRVFLPDVVAAFLRERPDTRIRVFDSSANEIIDHVRARTADFGVSLLGMVPPELQQQFLAEDPFILLVHCEHRLAKRKSVTWRELVGEPLIAGGGPSGNRSLMESVRAHIGVDLNWRHEVQHIPTAVEWTSAGVAPTIAPRLMLDDGIPENLRGIEITSPLISRRIGILHRAGERLMPAAEALRRAVAASLRAKLVRKADVETRKRTQPLFVRLKEPVD
jgi:DNA-binding transcriptional LysR family regulator